MEKRRSSAKIFGVMAAVTAVLAVCLCFIGSGSQPVLLSSDSGPQLAVTELFDAVCAADYDAVSAALYGGPELGLDREPASETGRLIMEAFRSSCSYTLVGDCRVSDTGLEQTVEFTSLDIGLLTGSLNERATALLEERVENARRISDVYEDDGSYREDVVMEVLSEAVTELLEDAEKTTVTLEIPLVYDGGEWKPVANDAFLNAIAGGTLY